MKPFVLILLLIGIGIFFDLLFRPLDACAALCRAPRQWSDRILARRPRLKVSGFSVSTDSLHRPFPRPAAHF